MSSILLGATLTLVGNRLATVAEKTTKVSSSALYKVSFTTMVGGLLLVCSVFLS